LKYKMGDSLNTPHGTSHFDASAQSWDSDPIKVARAQAVADGIERSVPLSSTPHALEYGCGTGLLSFALRQQLGHITLADSSPGMLAVLRQKIDAAHLTNLHPMQLDLVTDPIPAQRFDLIYSLMTFHHIENTAQILGTLHAMLNPSGYLCIADLDAEDGSFHGPEFPGHKGFDRTELGRKARAAGFGQVDFSTVFHMTKGKPPGQTEFPIFLMVASR
jgi:ubiquinone/menaquinone biosynthesis C-methylase UbiE